MMYNLVMILELLKKEIRQCGLSRYEIAKRTGVSQAQLCRFMKGQSFQCETADLLLQFFGYELKKMKRTKAGEK
ncbi:helix-turn-helix domain-containing protein [Planctomycetota bacterium]